MRHALLLLVLAAALAAATASSAATPKLTGVVGPGFTMTLKQGGRVVKTLKAGSYTIAVSDKATIHNFHLFGPGVKRATTVPFTGTKTWTVKLVAGTHTYQCDPHASAGMKGRLKVTG
ncbi:MAG: plastocyanin/azurin family copper-binding protein [Jatrophihabitantaceae bacterium]